MNFDIFQRHPYGTLSLFSFFVNVPLGYIRENHPSFSFRWLFWIHASIPLIIYLRITLGTSVVFMPVSILLAVAGQVVGSCWRRGQMSQEEKEQLKQIPPLDAKGQKGWDASSVAVVLLNMGGPKTEGDVPAFQKRLFSDPLLIRFPLSFFFQRFFAWLLATLRGSRTQRRYRLIGGGSPIFQSTQNQAAALKEALKQRGRDMDVIFSFNYSPPLPQETIQKVQGVGKGVILPLSLYPHYSKATTGSSIYYLKKAARRIYPEVRFIEARGYHLHDGYIQAFVDRIREQMGEGEGLDEFYLVFSAHSLPLYFLAAGDPYPFQIAQTVAKIVAMLERNRDWVISYQSAVGPLQWLKPSTEDMIEALIRRGFKKLLVVPVSFVTDHIETLCEIDIEYRQFAEKLGVEDFRMSKALECHPGFIQALADSVEEALGPRENKHDYPRLNV